MRIRNVLLLQSLIFSLPCCYKIKITNMGLRTPTTPREYASGAAIESAKKVNMTIIPDRYLSKIL